MSLHCDLHEAQPRRVRDRDHEYYFGPVSRQALEVGGHGGITNQTEHERAAPLLQ